MFLDASAIVAILVEELGWQELQTRLSTSRTPRHFSGIVRYEASLAIARQRAGKRKPTNLQLAGALAAVDEFLDEAGAENVDIGADISSLAIEASMQYGKSVGHPADLNLGDCFAYACAKALNVPLLYKGDDFAKTDLA